MTSDGDLSKPEAPAAPAQGPFSRDLPVALLTLVISSIVLWLLGVVPELMFAAAVLAALCADVIKNLVVSKDVGQERVVGLAALLVVLATGAKTLVDGRVRKSADLAVHLSTSVGNMLATVGIATAITVVAFVGVDVVREDDEPSAATEQDCGNIAFTENSDHGVFGITATGIECEAARRLVGAGIAALRNEGFTCDSVTREQGLRMTEYSCTRGNERITYSVT